MDDFLRDYGPILIPSLLLTISEVLGSSAHFKSNSIVQFFSLFLKKWIGGKTMGMFAFGILFLLTGCASVSPNHTEFYKSISATCAPSMLKLPAAGGGVYEIPLPSYNQDACKQGMITAQEINRSGWERFGVATVNMIGHVGVQAAPWFAVGYMAHEGFKAAGDNASGSYNTNTEANPVNTDNSNRSTNNPNSSTNYSNNPVDNSDSSSRPVDNRTNYENDNRTNYGNPVTMTPVPEVMP